MNETRPANKSVLNLLSNLEGLTPAGLKHLMAPSSTKNTSDNQSNSSLINSRARVVSPESNFRRKIYQPKKLRTENSLISILSSASILTAKRLNQSDFSLHFSEGGSDILTVNQPSFPTA